MYSAISTACLYPLETELALAELLRRGFRNFEVFANCESEFSPRFLRSLRELAEAYEASFTSVHLFTCSLEPFLFFTDYPRRVRDSVEQYRRYFAGAAALGARFAVFHGDRRDSILPFDLYCERLRLLCRAAASEGIALAQENVARCRTGTVAVVSAVRRALDGEIRFVLDVKQSLRAGESPLAMCDAMGGAVACVHLSDSTPEKDCMLPGDGSADLGALLTRLHGHGFDGPLITEVYRTDYENYEKLTESMQFLNKLLETFNL